MAFRQASSTKQVSQLIEHGTETSMPRCGWLAPGCPRLKACSGAWCTSARKNPWSSTWYAFAHVVVQPDGTHMSTRMDDTTPTALHEPCSHSHCVKPAPIHAAQQTGTGKPQAHLTCTLLSGIQPISRRPEDGGEGAGSAAAPNLIRGPSRGAQRSSQHVLLVTSNPMEQVLEVIHAAEYAHACCWLYFVPPLCRMC